MKTILLTLSAALCLSTVGCDADAPDPVVDEWTAPAANCNSRTQFEIDDDYKGDGRYVTASCTVCQVNIEVDPEGDGEYELRLDPVDCMGTLDLDCEIDDDELECEDQSGNRVDFEMD
jgi:hypothetical protein